MSNLFKCNYLYQEYLEDINSYNINEIQSIFVCVNGSYIDSHLRTYKNYYSFKEENITNLIDSIIQFNQENEFGKIKIFIKKI